MYGAPRRWLVVVSFDPDRPTAGVLARSDVSPSIADHERARKIHVVFDRGLEQKAGPGFSALALVGVVVTAHINRIQAECRSQSRMDGVYDRARRDSACDIRLVCDHDG